MAVVSIALLLIFRHRERLLASNRAFEQALHAREDMMAMVAHDLKNPINTILLRCHVMIEMLKKPDELNEIERNLQLQQRTARHMNQLISDLTDVARIQAARLHVELCECAVDQVQKTRSGMGLGLFIAGRSCRPMEEECGSRAQLDAAQRSTSRCLFP